MAKDGAAYSPKEFQLAFIAEGTKGTANTTTMQLINVDSVTMPNLNPVIVNEVRSGTGRVRKVADAFVCQKGIMKTTNLKKYQTPTLVKLQSDLW